MPDNKQRVNKRVQPRHGGAALPVPGPGRPKGSKNRFTALRDSFLQAFEELGGYRGLVEWAAKNAKTQGDFYRLVAKMLPANVTFETDGNNITVIFSKSVAPKKNGKHGKRKK